jgi:hypothetical protein
LIHDSPPLAQSLPVIQARVLTAIFEAAAVSPALRTQLLDTEGLRNNDLLGAEASIPLAAYMRLFERLALRLERPTLGLDLSSRMGPELIGALGYAFIHSATLDAAITAFANSVFSIQGVTALSYERATYPHVRYTIFDDRLHPRRQDVEFSLAYVHALIRRFLGRAYAPQEVHFEHPLAGPRGHYDTVFGCPVYFEQPSNAIILDDEVVAAPGRLHDPHLVSILRHALERGRPASDLSDAIARGSGAPRHERGDLATEAEAGRRLIPHHAAPATVRFGHALSSGNQSLDHPGGATVRIRRNRVLHARLRAGNRHDPQPGAAVASHGAGCYP